MAAEGLAALVVLGEANCRYLTGFTGDAASVCVTDKELLLFTDARFTIQAQQQAPLAQTVIFQAGADDLLPGILADLTSGEGAAEPIVGIDSGHLTVKRWGHLRPSLEEAKLEWRLIDELVENCRQMKFDDELAAMRVSAALATRAYDYLESQAVIGRTEREISLQLEMFLRNEGSEGVAFPFIVAAGMRGAMPHAEPSGATIEAGQLVVFDLGARVDGYASDVTRTFATGPIDDELLRAYKLVQEVQAIAVEAAKAGISCKDLDAVARDHFAEAGVDSLFVHSLGHGVGLEVHEGPTISHKCDQVLQQEMVITIEPGLYLPERGGIRIEDTVVIQENGAEILTDWPRELRFLH
ncbi:MAG: aminopeptidase P family protein [Actinobacteria bacterium]|nr:aminopeptidase P family protein [Actinomycetota bacterium]